MIKQQSLFKWLALSALVEWLLVRTLTRASIHIPKSPEIVVVYSAINQIGLVAAAFVALLSFVLLLWIAWQSRQEIWLSLVLLGVGGLSVCFLWLAPPVWLAMLYQLLALTAVFLICSGKVRNGVEKPGTWGQTAALLLPAGAVSVGLLYQLLPNLYALMGWPGPPPLTGVLFNFGELLVIGSVLVWWWTSRSLHNRARSWIVWLLAAIPALLFALSFWRDPAMTGILTIWSTGLTLFLPWPVYALALWLVGVTVLANWQPDPPLAYAILLLVSAGYTPQLSSQLFCALIALWLLARPLPITQNHPVHNRQPDNFRTEPQLITDN